jgi:hypothetical protein
VRVLGLLGSFRFFSVVRAIREFRVVRVIREFSVISVFRVISVRVIRVFRVIRAPTMLILILPDNLRSRRPQYTTVSDLASQAAAFQVRLQHCESDCSIANQTTALQVRLQPYSNLHASNTHA